MVVIPLHRSMARMLLNRTLLYTAATRAKQLLIIVGTEVSRVKQGRTVGAGLGGQEGKVGCPAGGGGGWVEQRNPEVGRFEVRWGYEERGD